MSRFLGITRECVFSPGKVDADRAILEATASCLRQQGQTVSIQNADQDRWPEPDGDTVVFAMCQGERALARLRQWEARGVRIVNCPAAIVNCQRHHTIAAFAAAAVPFPASVLLDTAAAPALPAWLTSGGVWVKRGDVHATEADDVVFVDNPDAMHAALERFRLRGITRAVLQPHVPGTVVKFYAVRGRFFHAVRPRGNDVPTGVVSRIDALAQRAARALQLEIYGGDCVVGVNGALTLIDLNDWPSYAPCRADAAREIAAYLLAHEVATEP
jgi:glutathione synthase/RimK-type ligase-like ATP-grasp enzyme